jgi:uncharacterized protein YcsI (UPF0317 family)
MWLPEAMFVTEVPLYLLYRRAALAEEPTDITHLWRNDLVAFLLGYSSSFEAAMQPAGEGPSHRPLPHVANQNQP